MPTTFLNREHQDSCCSLDNKNQGEPKAEEHQKGDPHRNRQNDLFQSSADLCRGWLRALPTISKLKAMADNNVIGIASVIN